MQSQESEMMGLRLVIPVVFVREERNVEEKDSAINGSQFE